MAGGSSGGLEPGVAAQPAIRVIAGHARKRIGAPVRSWHMEQQQAEFTEFYQSAREDCLRIVLVNVGDRELAEDLVAEGFSRAWASWPKVRQHPAPRAWVVRTALNANVSWWRRRRREVALEGHELVAPAEGSTGLNRPVTAALQRLPVRQRQVITLRLLLDLDTKGTARVLGISQPTVRAHLHRAIRGHAQPGHAATNRGARIRLRAGQVRRSAGESSQMNQTGGHPMNDEQVLTAMRRSLIAETDDLAEMGTGRPAEAVMARGGALRRRRRLTKSLSGVAAAGAALALVLTLPFGGTGTQPVHVNLAAWSVNTNPGGTVTFTLKKLSDPARLQHVLSEAGVPATVRWNQNCREPRRIVGAPAARAVSEKYVGGPRGRFDRADGQLLPAYAYTITPSAMPEGARFVISAGRRPAFERHNPRYVGPWIDWALVPAGASVTCGPAVPPEVG